MPVENRPLILSIETATRTGSVAITSGQRLIASREGAAQSSHSTTLLSDIDAILKEAGASLRDVDLFAVAVGPGSFTGLRIGLATAKSFAATLSRPCVGIPTLFAVAHAAGASERTLAMLPAGRGEVFAQLLSVGENGAVRAAGSAVHLPPRTLLDLAGDIFPLKWAGEGAHLHAAAIRDQALTNSIEFRGEGHEGHTSPPPKERLWVLAPPVRALAGVVAALGLRQFESGDACRPEDLRAIYVRPSDAELNEQCRKQKLEG